LRKAERVLQSREDARDVVQSLFLELLERGTADVDLPYLYRAVTNRCLNMLRDHKNRVRILQERDPDLRGPARTSCEDRVVDVDMLSKLASKLDPESCEIVVYRYVDDLQLEEIAELTGLSRKTVGKRLENAREAVVRLSERSGGSP
jgi:RNA polymerase sigma-70 factor (ECF subfamily)